MKSIIASPILDKNILLEQQYNVFKLFFMKVDLAQVTQQIKGKNHPNEILKSTRKLNKMSIEIKKLEKKESDLYKTQNYISK